MEGDPGVRKDGPDQKDQTSPVQTSRAQSEVDQKITAQTVSAPVLQSNVFHGPVYIGADTGDKGEDGSSTSSTADAVTAAAVRVAECKKLKEIIQKRYSTLFEGIGMAGKHILLNDIYSELYVVEDWRGGMNTDHEVIQIEGKAKAQASADSGLKISEIFHGDFNVRKVLTMGIAGIGKTVSVQKFALDWAEGKSNTDIDFVFVVAFRELNLLKDEKFDLPGLLLHLYPKLTHLKEAGLFDDECKCAFILDGLDELRKPLDFERKKISSTTEKVPVDVLVTSLITGALLESALVWITSRPAAADQIPLECIHQRTEVRGFVTDQQKEEYFRKRIKNEKLADKVLSHIKKLKTLYIMCYIPVFCWITYNVLQKIIKHNVKEIPKTLTQMYAHFLTIQMDTKTKKYNLARQKDAKKLLESNRTELLKLAQLAFKQLLMGNMMFYEEDLIESKIDVSNSMSTGIFTEIFKEECIFLYQRKVYCFVHLTFQEFLAAIYVFHCYESDNLENLEELLCFGPQNSEWYEKATLDDLLMKVVDTAVNSQNGHLDLFLRFLLGISLETNQRLLQGVLTFHHCSPETVTEYIKKLFKAEQSSLSTERYINLFLCLSEMEDQSLCRDIQEYLNSEKCSGQKLSPGQCSALAYMLLTSEEVLEELDLKKFNTSSEGYSRLVPAVSVCRKARIASCELGLKDYETLGSISKRENFLKEMDVSSNDLQDSGVEMLTDGLKSSHCKLEVLRLASCNLGEKVCEALGSVLQLESSSLKELDLSNNDLQDSGVEILSAGLKSSHCKLEVLRLALCNLGLQTCKTVETVLKMESSSLKELDLSNNDLQDSGVEILSAGLKSSHCKLQILRLSGCMITEKGCSSLASALSSNISHMKELDLTYNHPGEAGEKQLSARLEDPHCSLEMLRLEHGGINRIKPGLKKYGYDFTLDPNTANRLLSLFQQNRKVVLGGRWRWYARHPERFDWCVQVISRESVTGRCYWEAEWTGGWLWGATVAVSYKSISRKAGGPDSEFGGNESSWSLNCTDNNYTVCHNNNSTVLRTPLLDCRRVGVYVDCPAGALSFYSISSKALSPTLLHTFYTTFTHPIHAGIGGMRGVFPFKGSVSLCKME